MSIAINRSTRLNVKSPPSRPPRSPRARRACADGLVRVCVDRVGARSTSAATSAASRASMSAAEVPPRQRLRARLSAAARAMSATHENVFDIIRDRELGDGARVCGARALRRRRRRRRRDVDEDAGAHVESMACDDDDDGDSASGARERAAPIDAVMRDARERADAEREASTSMASVARLDDAKTRDRVAAWVEADALRRVSGRYCPFTPPPRSTIAVAYSPDGQTLASTHGDHTVKLIDVDGGGRVRALEGHGRTPWVVRFHPTNSDILASGSLDNTVIVWDRQSGAALARWDFGKSIASLAFYHEGDILCVTAGHKLYAWKYKKYRTLGQLNADGTPIDATKAVKVLLRTPRSLRAVHFHPTGAPTAMTAEVRDMDPASMDRALTRDVGHGMRMANGYCDQEAGVYVAARDAPGSRAGTRHGVPQRDAASERSDSAMSSADLDRARSVVIRGDQTPRAAENAITLATPRAPQRANLGVLSRAPMLSALASRYDPSRAPPRATAAPMRITGPPAFVPPGGGVAAAAVAAQSSGDQDPCIVRLKLWNFKTVVADDGELEILPFEEPKLVLEHTVLCSEMGAHFSPCGRYLATCQACKPPPSLAMNSTGETTRYVCELRTHSIDASNFGEVLNARVVKAAHCLTSIQFSPTSEHVLLAYGRRHPSLYLLMADAESFSQVHTILEIFSAKDMHLVRIIPSVEDEVNAACFHPTPGQGIAYGTKEGKLRILTHDRSPGKADKSVDAADAENSPLTTTV